MGARTDFAGQRRRPTVLAAAVVLGAAAGVVGYVESLPDEYTSSSVVAFVPKGPRPANAATVELATPRYATYLTSPYLMRTVAGSVNLEPSVLRRAVDVDTPSATANITIAVTLQDPTAAARAAEALTRAVVERAAADPVVVPQVAAPAVVPSAPSGPARRPLEAGGLLGALALGAAVLALPVPALRSRRDEVRARARQDERAAAPVR